MLLDTIMTWSLLGPFFPLYSNSQLSRLSSASALSGPCVLCVLCVLCVVGLFSAIGGPRWRYITASVPQEWPSTTLVDRLPMRLMRSQIACVGGFVFRNHTSRSRTRSRSCGIYFSNAFWKKMNDVHVRPRCRSWRRQNRICMISVYIHSDIDESGRNYPNFETHSVLYHPKSCRNHLEDSSPYLSAFNDSLRAYLPRRQSFLHYACRYKLLHSSHSTPWLVSVFIIWHTCSWSFTAPSYLKWSS